MKKSDSYRANWGDGELTTIDIKPLTLRHLPEQTDLVWASFPYQDLSLAGLGAGLNAARSGTFWAFWSLMRGMTAEGRAPEIIALENICGALSAH